MLTLTGKTTVAVACALAGMFIAGSAGAAASLSVPASQVRVQNYPSNGTALWYTGSPCASGSLVLDPTDTLDRHKSLLATVLAAKSMGAKLFIEYDIGGDQCIIRTFGVDGP